MLCVSLSIPCGITNGPVCGVGGWVQVCCIEVQHTADLQAAQEGMAQARTVKVSCTHSACCAQAQCAVRGLVCDSAVWQQQA